uniref:Uncharacterized protein n=1 Tax=viral metagenome TaxID=1070528 RepID=A0A6C0KMU6_9ZZZZ
MIANYIILFIILISLGILYDKYLKKQSRNANFDDYGEIKKYLLKDETLDNSKKPIMWIYIPYEYNARDWISFGSRSSCELNQPYLYLTVKSILKNCDNSFKIVLIDDGSFEKLIPGWNVNMSIISDPIKNYMRQLAITKLIYNYGGINVPISFLCFKDLISMYNNATNNDKMFVCENYDFNITSTNKLFYPNSNFMGANKNNETVREFINFIEIKISEDYTAQAQFLGDFDYWCNQKIKNGKVNLIPGTEIGTRTIDDEPVTVDILLTDDYIHFYSKMYGIWIPANQILKRRHYEWFSRMSPEQIFQSQFILAKYIVLALAPDSKEGVIEQMENKPDWISFWRVPLTNGTLNIFGPMPQNLGNNVPRAKNSGNLN